MTTADIAAPNERFLDPSQLCIGLHVHLDMPWTEHPFAFSSFRIKSLEQVAAIQSLHVARVRFSPDKSDAAPLPAPALGEAAPPAEPVPETVAGFEAKRRRLERLAAHRAQLAACEKQLLSSARVVRSINQNLFARPEEVKREAVQLVAGMAASLLVDVDIAIHLMAEKLGGEETYHHALNVALLAMMLGKELGLDARAVHLIGVGALFHDIGKLDLPERIVRKTDALTRAEASALQQHCAVGVEMARRLALPPEVAGVIAQHHEQVDGLGYPKHLAG
jgi:putative nucleotidyltransferase with HDIG domain